MKNYGIRVYDSHGRERWMTRPGQVVPAGWYNDRTELLTQDYIVDKIVTDVGNPYDQYNKIRYGLVLKPLDKKQ
jgi:hypothetical protein